MSRYDSALRLGPAYPLAVRRERIIMHRGCFMPHPDGRDASVVDVLDREGDMVDEVAWFDGTPAQWALRYGSAVALGEGEIERAWVLDMHVQLLATPAQWVANHGADGRWPAAAVVDWRAKYEIARLLQGVKIRTNRAIADRLDRAMAALVTRLDIEIPKCKSKGIA